MKLILFIIISKVMDCPFLLSDIAKEIPRINIKALPIGELHRAIEDFISISIFDEAKWVVISICIIGMEIGICQRFIFIKIVSSLDMVGLCIKGFSASSTNNISIPCRCICIILYLRITDFGSPCSFFNKIASPSIRFSFFISDFNIPFVFLEFRIICLFRGTIATRRKKDVAMQPFIFRFFRYNLNNTANRATAI